MIHISYQHDDPPDADHYPACGHLRPAEQKRRHGCVWLYRLIRSWFYFWFTKLRSDPQSSQSAEPHHSVLLGEIRQLPWKAAQRPIKTSQSAATNESVQLFTPRLFLWDWPMAFNFQSRATFPLYSSAFCCTIFILFFFWICEIYKLLRIDSNQSKSDVFFQKLRVLEILPRSLWKRANDSELANVTEANFS